MKTIRLDFETDFPNYKGESSVTRELDISLSPDEPLVIGIFNVREDVANLIGQFFDEEFEDVMEKINGARDIDQAYEYAEMAVIAVIKAAIQSVKQTTHEQHVGPRPLRELLREFLESGDDEDGDEKT